MPPMVAAAAVTAAGALGGAALQSRTAGAAARGQAKTFSAGLRHEREREATQQRERAEAMALHKQRWDAWNAARNEILRKHGINIPQPTASPQRVAGRQPLPTRLDAPSAGAPSPAGVTLGDFMGAPSVPAAQPPAMAPAAPGMVAADETAPLVPPKPEGGLNLGNLDQWNDWRLYAPR